MNLRRRVEVLEDAAPPGGCGDGWHDGPGKLAVVHGDDTPPPCCPTCGAEPATVIRVVRRREDADA